MEELSVIPRNMELKTSNRGEIDKIIEQTIALYKENGAMITKLTMDSVTALTASESRSKELAQQGFLKRFWNNLTGKNKNIRGQIDADITHVQYASQTMIQKLAEQNLFTFDLVSAVNNKINTLVLEFDEELNQVYEMLQIFFKQTRSEILQFEARLDKVERNVDLLHWNATIEYLLFEDIEYSLLPDPEKIVCISNDFLHRTKGNWSTSDLMLLKSTMHDLGLPIKQTFSAKSFFDSLIKKPILIDRLFEGISLEGLHTMEPYEIPMIKGIEKALKINTEEKYIYETVIDQLKLAGLSYDDREIKLSMIHQYMRHNAYMNIEAEVNLFEFVVGLLVDLNLINQADTITNMKNDMELMDEGTIVKGDHDLYLIDYGNSKVKVIKAVKDINSISLDEAKKLVEKVPLTIQSRITEEQAENAKHILTEAGAHVITKAHNETVQSLTSEQTGYVYINKNIKVGDIIEAELSIGKISGTPISNVTFNLGIIEFTSKRIYSSLKGKIISILVKDGEKVANGQPIILLLSKEQY